ncbi:methyltransferase domain-containing protein [Aquincola sp. S2]|uniref:Methyltransferase domain-containing protein n=2 Tax=Pseudaquabacterium terrae TaxID=2732868 RepID=A0ABX2E9J0_9BURK|nr:methyltransferase domain-containing protein [Aquabacterium terrae]
MGRWSRQLAPRFLHWLQEPPGRRWLDVGCGTGALSAAILDSCAPRSVIGVDPSEGFLVTAKDRLGTAVALHRAAASELPLPDAAVDVAVSGLVLNFVPDAPAALREMARVTVDGGRVAVYVWDYAEKMDLIRLYWNAAAQLDPASQGQDQGERFPLCRPDALAAAFSSAGLREVAGSAIDLPMHFTDFDDYWRPFLGGQGPAPAHAMSLDEASRERLRSLIRERMPMQPDGTIHLAARAWAARGVVAR